MKRWLNGMLVVLLIIPISGCTMGLEMKKKAEITQEQVLNGVAQILDAQKETVWPYVSEDLEVITRTVIPSSAEIVQNTLTEELGLEYLEFCYVVGSGETQEDLDLVVAYANTLLDEEGQEELARALIEVKEILLSDASDLARRLAPSQRVAFWKDMQKLVTRTLVLFTAGIVYACIPTMVFWGKITAAAAIAVATGIVSETVMSIWRYYQFGGDVDEAFGEWLKGVTTEPELSFALTASVMAVGNTLKRGPVVTGILICVFAIYNIIDVIKPMLKQYNFNV
ncbi:MAG: hypothetical protein WC954_07285 [Sphaerochaeta sp.]|jgi:hypothetical protein